MIFYPLTAVFLTVYITKKHAKHIDTFYWEEQRQQNKKLQQLNDILLYEDKKWLLQNYNLTKEKL